MPEKSKIAIIGAGLAGCEAAWQLARRGVPVVLFEMRPERMTPAHQTGLPAELVCSNSFKSGEIGNAHGLLKAELEAAGSIIISAAKANSVPAGSALAVDRNTFSAEIGKRLATLKTLDFRTLEIQSLEQVSREFTHCIIAAGPLMSDSLALSLREILEDEGLYFYDAIAPVVYADSIDMAIAFKASRYGKGEADYINCPLTKTGYYQLVEDLIAAEKVGFKSFEEAKHFEGCLPVEVLAERGADALSFGAMKPVGLIDPITGKQPWAVLQLRQEDRDGTLYNLVGCQTRMTWPEQKRVFRKIPGLENCEFARLGSMHRNTYVNAPIHLNADLSLKKREPLILAGQITGVEGYTESSAMGLWAALNLLLKLENKAQLKPNPHTMIGGLVNYLQTASPQKFQPMNANFGLLSPLGKQRLKDKKARRKYQAEQALAVWKEELRQLETALPETV